MTALRLGVSKVDITPHGPVALAGFSHRKGTSDGVVHPLQARVFAFGQGERTALLVSADLIWWGPESIERLRAHLQAQWGIPATNVFLHATHNHSGPQTSHRFVPSLGSCDDAYISWLEAQVHRAIADALTNMEPVNVQRGGGEWQSGIHRRRIVDGICTMAPNPDGPNDRDVTVVRFQTNQGDTKGILVHATCHPTTTDDNRVSSEFPGVAMDQVESHFGAGVVAAFLQGFCGDVRPALIKDDAFFRGTDEDVRRVGSALASEVIRILETDRMYIAEPGELATKSAEVNLHTTAVPDAATLREKRCEPGVWSEWANLLLAHPDRVVSTIPLEVSLLRISDGIAFLAANAEMVVAYGLHIKRLFGNRVLPLGYTNGMIGYIPTARQIAEGGYEAADSCYYFGLPAPFASRIEADITANINEFEKGWL